MKLVRVRNSAALIVLAVLAIGAAGGCQQKADDGLSPQQQAKASRLDSIAASSGGDWSKVPASDRAYVLSTFTYGDENSARMLILAKSGKLRAHPGGAPPGKAPGAPPLTHP